MAEITYSKLRVEYPIYIYTKSRRIRRVNCPVLIEFDHESNIVSMAGHVPEQLEDYLIIRYFTNIIYDGKFWNEWDFASYTEFTNYYTIGQAVFNILTYDEAFIAEYEKSRFDFMFNNVEIDEVLLRRAKQTYDFDFRFTPVTPSPITSHNLGVHVTDDYTEATNFAHFLPGQMSLNLFYVDIHENGSQTLNPELQTFNLYEAQTNPCNFTWNAEFNKLTCIPHNPDEPFDGTLHILNVPSGEHKIIIIDYTP